MPKKESKDKIIDHVKKYLDKYQTVIISEIKDLPADFIHKIRKSLRAIDSEAVCGKTTVISKAVDMYIEEKKKLPSFHIKEGLQKLSDSITKMQICVIFTNTDVSKVQEITNKFIVEKQAKPGAISPVNVTIPAGPTGMDSSQIEFFQALKIQTKVMKNQLEIVNDAKILVVGQKITVSEINLMKKFNIKPYKHIVQIKHIYMGGKVYGSEILNINEQILHHRVFQGIKNIASFSLQTFIPTKASAPHVVLNSLNHVLGLSLATGLDLPQFHAKKEEKEKKASPKKEDAPKGGDKGGKDKKKEEKKKEPEPEPPAEEEEAMGFGDMFG